MSRIFGWKFYTLLGIGTIGALAGAVMLFISEFTAPPSTTGTPPWIADSASEEQVTTVIVDETPAPASSTAVQPRENSGDLILTFGSETSSTNTDATSVDATATTEVITTEADPLSSPTVIVPAGQDPQASESADLTISGRVLNASGDPVGNMQITARPSGYRQSQAPATDHTTRSSAQGDYQLTGLVAGEYRLQTNPTPAYPTAIILARAGLQSADIVLNAGHTVEIFGTVTDTAGTPLADVEIVATHAKAPTRTNRDGNYALPLVTQQNRGYVFRFRLTGYNEERIVLPGKDITEVREKRIDAQLTDTGDAALVSGQVRSEYGESVPDVRIQLASSSLNATHQAVSDEQGEFQIAGVGVSTDYRLTVLPGDDYERYSTNNLTVEADNPPLDITLKSLATGRISGSLVDVAGNPVQEFAMMLRSSRKSHKSWDVVSDDTGHFNIEGVAEGELTFTTRSHPHLRARGVSLEPNAQVYVDLVLDWGEESLEGSVVSKSGEAVAGANVSLSWSHTSNGIQSSSSRRALTDKLGSFRFTQLGPGVHTLDVNATGYQRARVDYNIGQQFDELVIEVQSQEQPE